MKSSKRQSEQKSTEQDSSENEDFAGACGITYGYKDLDQAPHNFLVIDNFEWSIVDDYESESEYSTFDREHQRLKYFAFSFSN